MRTSRSTGHRIVLLAVVLMLVALCVIGGLVWQIASGRWTWRDPSLPAPSSEQIESSEVR